jgi:3-phenylpropionate/cinnamic acid dioxygenase small subunit
MTSDPIRVLLDHQEISDCLLRYARGVDRVDEDLIRSAFFPDAVDFHAASSAGSVDDFLAAWLPRQPGRHRAQHYTTNQSIDLDGDEAHVETYWLCVLKQLDADEGDLVGGRYLDRFERRDGEWRIAKRVVVHEWHSHLDFAPMRQSSGVEHWTRRDRSDLSYTRPLADPPAPPDG